MREIARINDSIILTRERKPMTQLLFSYGTLQQLDVQLATFGRA